MPVVDGLQVLRFVRSNAELRSLPVVSTAIFTPGFSLLETDVDLLRLLQ